MEEKRYYIAVDGGGTKTKGILTDGVGNELASLTVGATNPNDVGANVTVERLVGLISTLLNGTSPAVTVCAGIAGAGGRGGELEKAIAEKLPFVKVKVVSDVMLTLAAELPEEDGCCLISGTGSVCYAQCRGELHRIGGWGWIIDSGGSGYDIGRDGLEAVLAAYDGRHGATLLTELVSEKIGKHPSLALSDIYAGGKPFVASFAPCVIAAAKANDPVAVAIIERNMGCLAEYLQAASTFFGLGEVFKAVMSGGILMNHPYCVESLEQICGARGVAAHLIRASKDPVRGALAIAMKK